MLNRSDVAFFRRVMIGWFTSNRRDFPWRREGISNYELIISEILLQRTRAETVAKYYPVFFGKYPGWDVLIAAGMSELEEVLKPLGLYRHRAGRLFRIIQEYKSKNGNLPRDKNELHDSSLSTLYISNAYELFLLKHRSPLLDVNMARVLSRFFGEDCPKDVRHDRKMQEMARDVVNIKKCREINWAILDFAALVCRTSHPLCPACRLKSRCTYQGKWKEY
jgi:A/G-specific adenine glycosylase